MIDESQKAIDHVRQIQKAHMEDYMNNHEPMSQEEFNEIFELKEPIVLPAGCPSLSKRKARHIFTPEIRSHHFDRDVLVDVLLATIDGEPIQLVGSPGTGKTSLIEQFHARFLKPVRMINGGPGLEEDSLLGRPTTVETEHGVTLKEFVGTLLYGLKFGIAVNIDEFDLVDDKVWYACHDILGGSDLISMKHSVWDPELAPEKLTMSAHGLIVRHPSFRFWSTTNSVRGYEATRTRMTYINVPFLDAEKEADVLRAFLLGHKCLSQLEEEDKLKRIRALPIDSMIEFATVMRKHYVGTNFEQEGDSSDRKVSQIVCLRELKKWAVKTLWCNSVDHGFNKGVLSALHGADREFARLMYREVFSKDLDLKTPPLVAA